MPAGSWEADVIKRVQYALILLLLATIAVACATAQQLDTPNKRAYAAELAIQGALAQIDQYEQNGPHEHGQFTDAQWREIKGHLRELRDARAAMQVALQGERPIGTDVATVYRLLEALRPYIVREGSQ